MRKVVGIIGKKESGKTFGDTIITTRVGRLRPSCVVESVVLSRPIKDMITSLFPEENIDLDDHKWKEGHDNAIYRELGMTPRKLMQGIGSGMREIDPDIFVRSVIYRIRKNTDGLDESVSIIPDVRYRNEYERLREAFGDDFHCYRVINENTEGTNDTHHSEQLDWVNDHPEIVTIRWHDPDHYRAWVCNWIDNIIKMEGLKNE